MTFRGASHTTVCAASTLELYSLQPDVMALIEPEGSQAAPGICPRPPIRWMRRTHVLFLSENAAAKTQNNGTAERAGGAVCPVTPRVRPSPTRVPACVIPSSAESGPAPRRFSPGSTRYPGIIGLKLIPGSLITGPIDSVFQLGEAMKKFTLINQG